MKHKHPESQVLPTMEPHVAAGILAMADLMSATLTGIMRLPLVTIDARTGAMERDSPLFFGTGDNPSLF